MKRSEMEIYLEQHLIELRGYQEDNTEIVDVLLYAVEEAGMLPPKIKKGSHSWHIAFNKYYTEDGCPEDAPSYFCRWELETD